MKMQRKSLALPTPQIPYGTRVLLRAAAPLAFSALLFSSAASLGCSGLLAVLNLLSNSDRFLQFVLPALGILSVPFFYCLLTYVFPPAWWDLEYGNSGQRFLCPACLCFRLPQWACAACENEVRNDPVAHWPLSPWTAWMGVPKCPRCGRVKRVKLPDGSPGLRARCGECGKTCPRDPYHERCVTVRAVLRSQDMEAVAAVFSGPRMPEAPYVREDDGLTFRYVLNAEELPDTGRPLPAHHALHDVLWLWTAGDVSSLAMAQAVDRLQRLAPGAGERVRLLVGVAKDECAHVELLKRRFRSVQFGVPLSRFLPNGPLPTTGSDAPAHMGHTRGQPESAEFDSCSE